MDHTLVPLAMPFQQKPPPVAFGEWRIPETSLWVNGPLAPVAAVGRCPKWTTWFCRNGLTGS